MQVLIQQPEDQPDPSSKGFAVSPGTEVFAGVRTWSIFSTDQVRSLNPRERNCLFSYENKLRYFTKYSQSNCIIEHMAKKIMQHCHCLPFYFLGEQHISFYRPHAREMTLDSCS
jgi:acid-sensing ion channel, other